MLPSSLQISIVTHRPDLALLRRTLDALRVAVEAAQGADVLKTVHLALIDNSEDPATAGHIADLGRARFADAPVHVMYLSGHANIGYGAAHNLVLHGTGSDYHLVLNPDAELAPDALVNAIRWMDAHADVGALAPAATGPGGERQYLCKRYPSVLDLLLRAYAPRWLRRVFSRRLARYELRDVVDADPPRDAVGIPMLSGAFMLVRREAIDRSGGFDPGFFLYFEDFDWSRRLAAIMRNAYVPSVRIVHHGGGAGRKGLRHLHWFVASGVRFYRKHGWKWL
ncbi:MAG: glycosyltransferase family 2 protein [Casimicrobiaceae bacterium]